MRDGSGWGGTGAQQGEALVDEGELAMLRLGPWLLDVLDGKGYVGRGRGRERLRIQVCAEELM